MHNIRPQKLAAIGLDPASVRAANPRLIYASLNGFSEAGPYAGRPAYDDIVQGMCGLADLMRRQTGEPRFLPTVAADKTCALMAVHAIMAALIARARDGTGSQVEVSMFEAMTGFTLIEHLGGQAFSPPSGQAGYARVLAPSRRPWRTRDGHLCLMPYTDAHWARFFGEVGRPELASDPRFADMRARTENIEVLYALAAGFVAERTTAQWTEALTRLDIPHGPVNTLEGLFSDPHLQATGFFHELPAGDGRSMMRLAGNGIRLDGRTAAMRAPPRLGEHTRELLREAGMDDDAIDALIAAGAAAEAPPLPVPTGEDR
jgi:crotonobetainyl-CoA:carnitine CoA-transferase CaiB-like acyl-CoA transferase